jgi:hypothetical protein
MSSGLLYIVIGLVSGVAAGVFGIGGGILIVPALVYLAGFSPQRATGTSLAVLLPPIGLAAALEYYRHGNIDIRAAVLLAITMFVGAWMGAWVVNRISGPHMRLIFGLFLCAVGISMVYGALRHPGVR